jgi:ABC-type polysaccharide/polyol phosphate export permease
MADIAHVNGRPSVSPIASTRRLPDVTKYRDALEDMALSLGRAELWITLAWHDIKLRYRRSIIGPFWISIATLIVVGIMGYVYASILKQGIRDFLPFAAAGLIAWEMISACISEGARVFIDQSSAIRQVPLPLPVHVLRMVSQKFFIAAHNALAVLLILLALREPLSFNTLWLLPGLVVVLINLFWIALLLGILSARFRDVPVIVNCLMPVLFLSTPVFWRPEMLPASRSWFVNLNPIANLIEVLRNPILGAAPSASTWLACGFVTIVGCAMTVAVYAQCRHRVALWV